LLEHANVSGDVQVFGGRLYQLHGYGPFLFGPIINGGRLRQRMPDFRRLV
jgi:hypothetical protein